MNGGRAGCRGAARRNLPTAAPSVVFRLGLQRPLHDLLAGTAVIHRGALATPASLTDLVGTVTGAKR